ncbi:MAG TPA: amino acid racemase [Pyrinomonadaceae bacterium]|nr:amino acid racemase [Pyrinomonadaceae bacterium]
MKTIGIAAHSAEGAALCFLTACHEGSAQLGPHMYPNIVMSAVPMALSLPGWEADDHAAVGKFLAQGVQTVADGGADFFVCPDNTAHIVLEKIANDLPLPGLHIAEVVCSEISKQGWKQIGLLGTRWTMTGPVYRSALEKRDCELLVPDEPTRERLNAAIFDELCMGVFNTSTTDYFLQAIDDLKSRGAECVILGCTEIPLIVTPENSSLPILDSTRLLAKYAVREAISDRPLTKTGWLPVS